MKAIAKSKSNPGFTLIELMVVLGVVALLMATLLPALARSRHGDHIVQCINNARQMALAVQLYIPDNSNLFPPNPDDGNTLPGYNWCPGLVNGGMGSYTGPHTFDPDFVTNASSSLLVPYIGADRIGMALRCPDDPRRGLYQGTNSTLIGKLIPAVRSISMNGGVGTVDPSYYNGTHNHSGKPTLPVNGSWLGGAPISPPGNFHDNPWATFGSTTDFGKVSPAQIFLFADEDPYSINDGALGVVAASPKFADFPATCHDCGATFSFCDGRVELHRWTGTAIIINSGYGGVLPTNGPDFNDWTWLWQHSTMHMP